jgi:hypothetical protein
MENQKQDATPVVNVPPAVKENAEKLRHKLVENSAKAPQFVQTYVCKLCQGHGHVIVTTDGPAIQVKETMLRCEKCNRTWVERVQ